MTLIFAGIMAIVLAAIGLFLYLRLGAELDQSINADLESRSNDLISLIRDADTGLGEPVRGVLKKRRQSFAQVLTPAGTLFVPQAQPPGRPVLDPLEAARAFHGAMFVEHPRAPGVPNGPVRLLATPINFEHQRLIVVVGASLADREDALGSLATLLFIGGPIALLLASLVAYGTVTAALRPVEAMRRRAATISAAEPDARLPVPAARDELSRLAETLNLMLGRLEAVLERERRFVDDASHELRTPLSLQKTELELALRYADGPEELRAAITSAAEEVDRLIQLAEDLLVVARSEHGGIPLKPERVEVGRLFDSIGERFRVRAQGPGRRLSHQGADGIAVKVDRPRIEQALSNMVENALRHGDGDVRLWAEAEDARVQLHVGDRGPGFPPEFLDRAFERFSRADAARSAGGSGLGLSIVQVIASAHGGRAGVRNRAGGGADVWIEVPSASS